MKNRKLIVFFLVTLAVIIAAGLVTKFRAPQNTFEKTKLFPELASRINQVARITIEGEGNKVELVESDGTWAVASSANYPAIFNRVRAVALNLSQLQVVDEKTDKPALYDRLGVGDPEHEDARSRLLTLYDKQDKPMASLIVGRPRQSSGSKPGLYVRLPGEKTTLLVEGHLDISAQDTDWYIRDLINIPSAVIKQVDIAYPDGKIFSIFKDKRQQPDYKTTDPGAENTSVSKIIINRISKGLEELRAEGVVSSENITFPDEFIRTTYTTFDGIITTIKLARVDGKPYARFSFSVDEELAAEADAAAAASEMAETEEDIPPVSEVVSNLNNRLGGWIYRIPDFKYEAMTTNLDRLK